jgi:hypothetical protein
MNLDERSPIIGAFAGIVAMLVTFQAYNMAVIGEFPVVRFVSIPLLGVDYWGIPLPWLKRVVYLGAPTEVIWANAVADLLFWVAVALFLQMSYVLILRLSAGGKKAAPKRKASRRSARSRRSRGSIRARKARRRR